MGRAENMLEACEPGSLQKLLKATDTSLFDFGAQRGAVTRPRSHGKSHLERTQAPVFATPNLCFHFRSKSHFGVG